MEIKGKPAQSELRKRIWSAIAKWIFPEATYFFSLTKPPLVSVK